MKKTAKKKLQVPTNTFYHKCATWSLTLLITTVFLMLFQALTIDPTRLNQTTAPLYQTILVIGRITLPSGFILAVIALFGIRKYGAKKIAGKAISSLFISALFLAVLIYGSTHRDEINQRMQQRHEKGIQ